jgi:hypothetical protein
MIRGLLIFAFCLLAVSANAESIQKKPQESAKDFAARYAPNSASEVVHIAAVTAWRLDKPVIVSFYKYPVSFADRSKNYGESPNESEVLGVIYIPINATEFKRFEIDGYGPEGSNAEINSFFFAKTDRSFEDKLFVMVSWHTNNGVLYSTHVYEKPELTSSKSKLVYLAQLSQTFGMECDQCPADPNRAAKFKTAADVKAELRRLFK